MLLLGFGIPYFTLILFLKGTIMKKFILFSPWLLKSPVEGVLAVTPALADGAEGFGFGLQADDEGFNYLGFRV